MIKVSNMENAILKHRLDLSLTNANIITYTAVAIFLPYILSAIVLSFLAIYILANKYTRQLIFVHKGSNLLKLLFIYILFIPFVYKNWTGLLVGAGMILAIIFGLYMRSVMTKELYERLLHLICMLSVTSAGYAVIEAAIHFIFDGRHSQRIAAVFSHPNYFGTVIGMVIMICAYKLLTNQGNRWFYIIIAGINVISIYLCKSMFVWIEIFLGVSVLLITMKKHKLLAIWLSGAVLGAFCIFVLNFHLVPRISDAGTTIRIRQQIWRQAIVQIKATPFFGHGFMSFSYLYDSTYLNRLIPHSHNIYLDMLLNFGVVGTGMILWFVIKYYVSIIIKQLKEKKVMIVSLILAVSVAALAHGFADLTLLWIQTLPLFLIILSGIGADEKICILR